jgi:hypothetical protein
MITFLFYFDIVDSNIRPARNGASVSPKFSDLLPRDAVLAEPIVNNKLAVTGHHLNRSNQMQPGI